MNEEALNILRAQLDDALLAKPWDDERKIATREAVELAIGDSGIDA